MAYRDPNIPASPEAVAALLAAATTPDDRALVGLVALAGLRPWEVCALTLHDVAMDGRAVRPGKGPLRRLVVLPDPVAADVQDAAHDRAGLTGGPPGPLLRSPQGFELSPKRAMRRLTLLARRAGLTDEDGRTVAPTFPQLRAHALSHARKVLVPHLDPENHAREETESPQNPPSAS